QAEVDGGGCYTGQMDRYAYGESKADLMREVAQQRAIALHRSWAYSDSATDVPMLEAVGHPVAVNPDRALRRIAQLRGWEVVRFERTLAPKKAPVEAPVSEPMGAEAGRTSW